MKSSQFAIKVRRFCQILELVFIVLNSSFHRDVAVSQYLNNKKKLYQKLKITTLLKLNEELWEKEL